MESRACDVLDPHLPSPIRATSSSSSSPDPALQLDPDRGTANTVLQGYFYQNLFEMILYSYNPDAVVDKESYVVHRAHQKFGFNVYIDVRFLRLIDKQLRS